MNLLIRTDANVSMGTGHVMRCLALAQAWQDEGGRVIFAMADATAAVEERLRKENIEIVRLLVAAGTAGDSKQTTELARKVQADWVVVDGYQFGACYQQAIKKSGQKLLFLDDNGHSEHYVADLVLNANIHATERLYASREQHTRLLLGTRYAILRREFLTYRRWEREIEPEVGNALVTFGGSDQDNITARAILALQQLELRGTKMTIVVGGSNPHFPLLRKIAASSPLQIQFVVNSSSMAELMIEADFAICGAGSTCWEMCLLGLPAIIIDVAANQRALAQRLNELGAAAHVPFKNISSEGLAEEIARVIKSPEIRRCLSAKARELVDGYGSARVLASMMSDIHLRPTSQSDCQFLWEWANEPEVRAMSFSNEPIPWERHVAWFTAKLANPSAMLYIATDSVGRPIGQVRYELGGERAAVSLNVGPEFRGKGYGKKMLLLATAELFRHSQVRAIDAFVKPCNEPSLRLFEAAGFASQGVEQVGGQQAVHFTLARSIAQ